MLSVNGSLSEFHSFHFLLTLAHPAIEESSMWCGERPANDQPSIHLGKRRKSKIDIFSYLQWRGGDIPKGYTAQLHLCDTYKTIFKMRNRLLVPRQWSGRVGKGDMLSYKKETLGVLVLIEMFYIWTVVVDRQTYM